MRKPAYTRRQSFNWIEVTVSLGIAGALAAVLYPAITPQNNVDPPEIPSPASFAIRLKSAGAPVATGYAPQVRRKTGSGLH
jgi:hypothetical protein